MSSPDITEKGSSAELDVTLKTKEADGIPLPESLSLSTVGLNSINEEIELREESQQPVDVALDGEREGAEEVVEEVGILEQLMEDASVQLSRAPSLAESLAPSLASFKNVTEAVAAA